MAIMSGSLNWTNNVFKYWMIILVADECTGKASIHLDPALIMIRKIYGLKMVWCRDYGLDGHGKGFNGV